MARMSLTLRITCGINDIRKSAVRFIAAYGGTIDGSTDCGTGI
jgi:hypothetical protein